MSALVDPFEARRVVGATGILREFNDIGVLSAADVHVAARLCDLVGDESEPVALAVALAVRGPRLGHVFIDLATIRDTASVESDEPVDLSELPWPSVGEWLGELARSELVAVGEDHAGSESRPLRLLGSRLYLDRYWREERAVAADLNDMTASGRLEVIAGGPGTGKTTRVARMVAEMIDEAVAAGARPPLVALAAPTGKAAARLEEAVHEETAQLPVGEDVRALLMALRASTLHRLLGWRPGSHSRFAHDRGNRLPHDVVIVDETSMVSLSLMARLVEAVRPEAKLILVGDPGQLTSIEAGVVLGDIVDAGPGPGPGRGPGPGSRGEGVVVLTRVHRYGGGIAALADAIRVGDGDATVAALRAAPGEITWLDVDLYETEAGLELVRERAVAAGLEVVGAAREGAASEALAALGRFRLLCAHRRGPYGVSDWSSRVQAWLAPVIEDIEQRDFVGRPLLVTENDYELGLYNGDTGVIVVGTGERPAAAFERGGEVLRFSPLRLGAVDTVYAMTIHKSQGSQFDTAAVLLPAATSRILTRELLYTGVTRARRELILVGTEAAVRQAVERPVARASGLRERLWTRE